MPATLGELVAPSAAEASAGRASRVELYACAACGALTRFARFGDVREVLRTRRGRCGEYSWLALRMLEALGLSVCWAGGRRVAAAAGFMASRDTRA